MVRNFTKVHFKALKSNQQFSKFLQLKNTDKVTFNEVLKNENVS